MARMPNRLVSAIFAATCPVRAVSPAGSPLVTARIWWSARSRVIFCLVQGATASDTVPWLSGRASRSHREGRWFDPSRDHDENPLVTAGFLLSRDLRLRAPWGLRGVLGAASVVEMLPDPA